jgi:thioesterase domain-containing protein
MRPIATIGRPIANTKTYVLDRFGQPVPVGAPGEMYIAGAGVADGYVNRPDETARFSEDPFNPGGRMYRTGDRVRQLDDGRFEPLGRLDDQVKLRGYRIEPGEIEASLRTHAGVASAVIELVDGSSPYNARLVAYVVPRTSMPSHRDLREHLRLSLPEYMVPSTFVELTEIPMTPRRKLDRPRLPVPPASGPSSSGTRTSSGGSDASLTSLEERLLGIWRVTLGVESLGVEDNFFEFGGHSLLAVGLVAAGSRLGMEVPLSFLYERGATVRGMAAMIEAAERGKEGTSTTSSETPPSSDQNLYVVVPHEPGLVALRHLRSVFGREQAVVGLLGGHLGQSFDRSKTVEDRAASMLKSIVQRQDRGPYFLAGFSFGGLIAYEIATRLNEDGQQVAWLGLVNTGAPAALSNPSRRPVKLARALVRPRAATTLGRHRRLGSRGSDRGADRLAFDGVGAIAIGSRYALRSSGIALDVFVSRTQAILEGRSLGWSRSHADLVRIHAIPGTERAMLDPRTAPAIARAIRESVDGAR